MYRVDLHRTLNKRGRVSLTSASKMDKKIEPTGLPLQAGNDLTITENVIRPHLGSDYFMNTQVPSQD